MTILLPIRYLAAIVFPWQRATKDTAATAHWCLHVLFWTCVLAGLWQLNRLGGVDRVLRSSWPALHRAWMPLLGLLVYALGWLSRGLWLALQRDSLPSAWPEIERAWSETCAALDRASIPLRDTPLFLILGPLTPELQSVLLSRGAVAMAPQQSSPFHVFANQEAVFVVGSKLTHLGESALPAEPRLHHLCKLLARDRGPEQPIQGIVLLVPFKDIQRAANMDNLVQIVQADLRIVRQATETEFPIHVVVSGLDPQAAPAPGWFQRFPLLPDLDPAELPTMFQGGLDWLCRTRIATDIRAHFRVDVEPTQDKVLPDAVRENLGVYQRLSAVHAWRTRLGRLLAEGTRDDYSEPGMVAGCYFLSGDDASALWSDLHAHQQTALWTAEAIAAHARRRRHIWLGYSLGMLGLCVVLAGLGWLLATR